MQKQNTQQVVQIEELPEENASNASLAQQPSGEISSDDLEDFVPQMNVSTAAAPVTDAVHLIPDDQYLGLLQEIMGGIREDRQQVSDYIDNFAEMVINSGDATTSSKEAFVGLVKIKTDLQDKMLKAATLITQLKMKNTYAYSGPHLNAMQQNNFNIGTDTTDFNRKELIKAINHAKKKKDKES